MLATILLACPPIRALEQCFLNFNHRGTVQMLSQAQHAHLCQRRRRQQQKVHFLSSSSTHGHSGGAATPWKRGAKIVKDTDVINPYFELVRSEVVDPALHIKTIEDELCGAIGKALGKQGEKVSAAVDEMKKSHAQYLECIRAQCYDRALQCAHLHNDARKRAIQARWELLVHRQAVGFTVDNHSVVHKTFPIDGALPADMEEIRKIVSPTKEYRDDPGVQRNKEHQHCTKKAWGDQLSWWERVGRWK